MAKIAPDRKKSRRSAGLFTHLIIFLVCVVLMLAGKADISAMNSARGIIAGFFTPIAEMVSVPFRAIGIMADGIGNIAQLSEENIKLKEQVKQLQRWQHESQMLLAENRQLRALSNFPVPTGMKSISARIVAINADSFAHSVMIDAGAGKGIKKGATVTTEDGLVGIVVEVGRVYAQVLLITDLNAMIPVILSDTSWPVIAAGNNSHLLDLQFVPSQAELELGELVQTSGHGGVLPAGLPVGQVVQITENYIRVKPVVDIQRLRFVTVLIWPEENDMPSDKLFDQSYSPLPDEDNAFSLEGINAFGQRTGAAAEGDQ